VNGFICSMCGRRLPPSSEACPCLNMDDQTFQEWAEVCDELRANAAEAEGEGEQELIGL
jgi:hypothetical protein